VFTQSCKWVIYDPHIYVMYSVMFQHVLDVDEMSKASVYDSLGLELN